MEQYLTVNEAARILKCAPRTVQRRIREGLITASKPPGSIEWRISELDLVSYLKSGTNGTTEDKTIPNGHSQGGNEGVYYMDIDMHGEAKRHLEEIKACILQAGSGLDAERVFWLEALGYIVNLETGMAWQYE